MIRKKIAIEDMANATLAGGVIIDSLLGLVVAGFVDIGFHCWYFECDRFAIIQPRVQKALKGIIDTCGVHNLPWYARYVGRF